MLELFIWIFLGAICGWIGYLAAVGSNKNLKLYMLIGISSATISGLLTMNLGAISAAQINVSSLMVAVFVSSLSVLALGLIDNSHSH